MSFQSSFPKFVFALEELRAHPSADLQATCQTHLDAVLSDGFTTDQKKAVKAALLSMTFEHTLSTGTEAPEHPEDNDTSAYSFGGMWIDPTGSATGFVPESA